MNIFTGVGRLTKDIELKQTTTGTPYARVSMAIGDGYFKEGKEGVDFIPLLIWSKAAENANKYIGRGSLVSVRGRYQSNSYQNQEGKTVYGHDIVVEEIRYLDKKDTNTQPKQQTEPQQSADPFANQPQQQQQPGYNPASNAPQGGFGFNR